MKFSLGKAEGGDGFGGHIRAVSGLVLHLIHSEGQRTSEGDNDDNDAPPPLERLSTC